MQSIFVGIAAYCDPELPKTIRHAIAKSSGKFNLAFGVCIQDTFDKTFDLGLDTTKDYATLSYIYVDYKTSQGCCWARAQMQTLYKGEDYYLQLDSHHRFVQDWDLLLTSTLKGMNDDRAILTTYVAPYTLTNTNDSNYCESECCYMYCDRFQDNRSKVLFRPGYCTNHEKGKITKTLLFSAHFAFTYGRFVKEIPYDPNFYFDFEEDSLSIRCFTHGWNLYNLNIPVIFHLYTRDNRKKHWDHHSEWYKRDLTSQQRFADLIDGRLDVTQDAHMRKYGLGPLIAGRSFQDFQRQSGIYFRERLLLPHARKGECLSINANNSENFDSLLLGFTKHNGSTTWHENEKTFLFTEIDYIPEQLLILWDASRNLFLYTNSANTHIMWTTDHGQTWYNLN